MSPVINKKTIREKSVKYLHEKAQDCTPFYGSMAWRRLRYTFLTQHPLCQVCLDHQKVTPAEDIHHKRVWLRGKTEEDKWNLFLAESNLMSVCSRCHHALHNKDKKYHLNVLDSLTDSEYREAHEMYNY